MSLSTIVTQHLFEREESFNEVKKATNEKAEKVNYKSENIFDRYNLENEWNAESFNVKENLHVTTLNTNDQLLIKPKYDFDMIKTEVSAVGNTESNMHLQNPFSAVTVKQEVDKDTVEGNSKVEEKPDMLKYDVKETYTSDNKLLMLKEYKIEPLDDIKLEDGFVESNVEKELENVGLSTENAVDRNNSDCCETQQEKASISEKQRLKYTCDQCPFQSKDFSNHKRHQMTHRDPSERKLYECEHCDIKLTSKKGWKMHVVRHKDPAERPTLRCDSCDFVTMYKSALTYHKMRHKAPTDVETFSCSLCVFESRSRSHFNRHVKNRHPEVLVSSDKKIYQCEQCNTKLLTPANLKKHMLLHENAPNKPEFQCDRCDYKTVHKSVLKQHKLKHLSPSEVNMLKCDFCDYVSKYKSGLAQHLKSHVKSRGKLYDCDQCGAKLATRTSLRMHSLKHKQSSEVPEFRCDVCEYKSIYKSGTKRHKLMMHSDRSQLTMLTCGFCEFVTKYKGSLVAHVKRHHAK